MPWKLRSPSAPLPLNSDDLTALAAAHDFTVEDLAALNHALAWPLDTRMKVRSLYPVVEGLPKADRLRAESIQQLGQMRPRIANLRARAAEFYLADDPETGRSHQSRVDELEAAFQVIEAYEQYLTKSERDGSHAHYRGNPNKRRNRDDRRGAVCRAIFQFWMNAGRPLTYSTSGVTSDRGGKLFTFVNDVVACVTEPRKRLKGETLKVELAVFQDRLAKDALIAAAGLDSVSTIATSDD